MSDIVTIPSPCNKICKLLATKVQGQSVCEGCGLTVQEIARWSHTSDADRKLITKAAADRLANIERQRLKLVNKTDQTNG